MKKKIKFKAGKKKISIKYVLTITFTTMLIAILMNAISDALLENILLAYSYFILLGIILIGIIFDIVGVAVTSCEETRFHAMASDRVYGAKESIMLIKNAEKVSSICNDVIGDVCGIVSGAVSSWIVVQLATGGLSQGEDFLALGMTGIVSAITVGGKAMGKFVATNLNCNIVYMAGKIIRFFKFKKD